MAKDLIRELGALAFASRLKRLSERLQRDVSNVYRDQGLPFRARWFPVAYLLWQHSSVAVTEAAETLGLTHAAVNQIAGEMAGQGLLRSRTDRSDRRRRLLSLTDKGLRIVDSLKPVWETVEKCTRAVLKSSNCNLLEGIRRMEMSLDNREMYERIQRELTKLQQT